MLPSDLSALFVYGTLMVPEVLVALLGRVPKRNRATLKGYRRYAIAGECYPAIITDPTTDVEGWLLTGLTPVEMATLDAYEGDAYVRLQVTLTVDGTKTFGDCYVWRSTSDVRFGRDDWNLETFLTAHLAGYLRALT
jgi:gamma-glutamylcyclotransferase (GGCT)/AIG2-like uncharacterized protein YtfP